MEKLKVLAIGAHADECQTGCGGTLKLLADAGCDCTMLHVSNHNHIRTPEELKVFDADIDRSVEMLSCRHIVIGDRGNDLYEGGRQDLRLISEQLVAIQPNIVFIQWPRDSHPEHRRVGQCSYDAILKSFWDNKLHSVREIYAYEGGPNQSMMQFYPDLYINVSSVEEILLESLRICIAGKGTMIARRKHDRCCFRGWCGGFNGNMTEGFKVIKFPEGCGLDESDLVFRRILADKFRWAGGSPWPYGTMDYQN